MIPGSLAAEPTRSSLSVLRPRRFDSSPRAPRDEAGTLMLVARNRASFCARRGTRFLFVLSAREVPPGQPNAPVSGFVRRVNRSRRVVAAFTRRTIDSDTEFVERAKHSRCIPPAVAARAATVPIFPFIRGQNGQWNETTRGGTGRDADRAAAEDKSIVRRGCSGIKFSNHRGGLVESLGLIPAARWHRRSDVHRCPPVRATGVSFSTSRIGRHRTYRPRLMNLLPGNRVSDVPINRSRVSVIIFHGPRDGSVEQKY